METTKQYDARPVPVYVTVNDKPPYVRMLERNISRANSITDPRYKFLMIMDESKAPADSRVLHFSLERGCYSMSLRASNDEPLDLYKIIDDMLFKTNDPMH